MTEAKNITQSSDTKVTGNNCIEAVNLTAERSDRILDNMTKLLNNKTIQDPEVLRQIGNAAVHAALIRGAMEHIGSKSTNMATDTLLLEAVR